MSIGENFQKGLKDGVILCEWVFFFNFACSNFCCGSVWTLEIKDSWHGVVEVLYGVLSCSQCIFPHWICSDIQNPWNWWCVCNYCVRSIWNSLVYIKAPFPHVTIPNPPPPHCQHTVQFNYGPKSSMYCLVGLRPGRRAFTPFMPSYSSSCCF